jgi:hypothetical protein
LTRRISLLVLLVLTVGLLAGCSGMPLVNQDPDAGNDLGLLAQQEPLLSALRAIELIKARDWESLASIVHPQKGLRFTAYPYIDLEKDRVFTTDQVAELDSDTTVYVWGEYDGSGDPIELTFGEYYGRFVYDVDFAQAPMVGRNHSIGWSNTINNIEEAYPNGGFIEFHFPEIDPQYGGIDWRSLRLVFEQEGDAWYLVGIVHAEWTI